MSEQYQKSSQPYPDAGQNRDLDANQNSLVSSRGPVESHPHTGHGGTAYEEVDARAGLVLGSLAVIGGTLVFVFALTLVIHSLLIKMNPQGSLPSPMAAERVIPPKPTLEVHPWDILPDLRAHEDQVLESTGKDVLGRTHIPIDRAMDAEVSRLNLAPGAPVGIRTPGGDASDSSGGTSSKPVGIGAQPRPQIQGEIRKNAR
ncbi:MAG: hypothetical protein ACJ74Y_07380 [Bryobacteraceae bacterium]